MAKLLGASLMTVAKFTDDGATYVDKLPEILSANVYLDEMLPAHLVYYFQLITLIQKVLQT